MKILGMEFSLEYLQTYCRLKCSTEHFESMKIKRIARKNKLGPKYVCLLLVQHDLPMAMIDILNSLDLC